MTINQSTFIASKNIHLTDVTGAKGGGKGSRCSKSNVVIRGGWEMTAEVESRQNITSRLEVLVQHVEQRLLYDETGNKIKFFEKKLVEYQGDEVVEGKRGMGGIRGFNPTSKKNNT